MNCVLKEFNPKEGVIILPSSMGKSKIISFAKLTFLIFSMYIYGGNDIREGQLNSLWCFELERMGNLKELADFSPGPDTYTPMEWIKVETTGKAPGKQSLFRINTDF